MNRLLLLYRPVIIVTATISILLLWALSSSIGLILKKDEVVVIKINDRGDATVIGSDDQEESTKAFARRYILLMYNYDYLSFETNVRAAMPIFSQSLWDKTKKDIWESKNAIEEKKITQTSAIESNLAKVADGTYMFITQTTISKEVTDGQRVKENLRFKVKLTVIPAKKTRENPWGLEVADATEERIN